MIRVHWHYTALNIMKNMGTWADGLMEQNLTKFIFYSDFIRHTIQRLNFCWMPKTNNFLHWIVGQWSTRVCPILTSHCYCVKRPLLNIDIALLLCKTTFISISRVDLHFTKFKGIFERRIQYPLISATWSIVLLEKNNKRWYDRIEALWSGNLSLTFIPKLDICFSFLYATFFKLIPVLVAIFD